MKHSIILLTLILTLTFAAAPALAEDKADKINLNRATVEQLAAIPGLNQDMAEKIVQLRKENGEFVDMSELLDIDGMDNALLRKLDKHLFIEPASDCNC